MKSLITLAMLKLPGCKGTIKEIKTKVMDALKPEDRQSK
jgi:hypothetical protein